MADDSDGDPELPSHFSPWFNPSQSTQSVMGDSDSPTHHKIISPVNRRCVPDAHETPPIENGDVTGDPELGDEEDRKVQKPARMKVEEDFLTEFEILNIPGDGLIVPKTQWWTDKANAPCCRLKQEAELVAIDDDDVESSSVVSEYTSYAESEEDIFSTCHSHEADNIIVGDSPTYHKINGPKSMQLVEDRKLPVVEIEENSSRVDQDVKELDSSCSDEELWDFFKFPESFLSKRINDKNNPIVIDSDSDEGEEALTVKDDCMMKVETSESVVTRKEVVMVTAECEKAEREVKVRPLCDSDTADVEITPHHALNLESRSERHMQPSTDYSCESSKEDVHSTTFSSSKLSAKYRSKSKTPSSAKIVKEKTSHRIVAEAQPSSATDYSRRIHNLHRLHHPVSHKKPAASSSSCSKPFVLEVKKSRRSDQGKVKTSIDEQKAVSKKDHKSRQKKESREKSKHHISNSTVSPALNAAKRRRTLSLDENFPSDDCISAASSVRVEAPKSAPIITAPASHHKDNAVHAVQPANPPTTPAYAPATLSLLPAAFYLSEYFRNGILFQPSHQSQASAHLSLPSLDPLCQPSHLHLPMPVIGTKPAPTVKDFIFKILAWNPAWLEDYYNLISKNVLAMLPEVAKVRGPLLLTYDSFDDYTEAMTPLLLLETWERVCKSWEESMRSGKLESLETYEAVKVRSDIIYGKNGKMIKFTFHVPRRETQRPLGSFYLVILKYSSASIVPARSIFGFITSVTPLWKHADIDRRVGHHQEIRGPSTVQSVELKVNYRDISVEGNELYSIQVLENLATQVRQYDGLCQLHWNTLATDILRPVNGNVFRMCRVGAELHPDLKKFFNAGQSLAIRSLTSAVLEPNGVSKIALLRGPPGTGKSHTIAGLIQNLIAQSQQTKEKYRILLCAPSNGAVDEICKKITKSKTTGIRRPKVVRLCSTKHTLNPAITECSLERATQRAFHREFRSKLSGSHAAAIDDLYAQINNINKERHKPTNDKTRVSRLDRELQQLNERKTQILPKCELTAEEKTSYGHKALMNADVVCTTLNYCGSMYMQNLLCVNSSNNQEGPFSAAIIDDAGQSIELDTLIPLKFSISKLILVGDPQQLPPTVLCQRASENNFGQSLFERLGSHLQLTCKENPQLSSPQNPVMLLTEQWRMHPEICDFPNLFIYDNQLITPRCIQEHRSRFPFVNYRVFDVQHSREKQDGVGMWNPEEGDFVVELCAEITADLQRDGKHVKIGVIAPYNRQKQYIQRKLEERKNFQNVECGTVDGFQGREKDVIVLSCVRAQGQGGASKGIGLLADKRRMNVALTRAKFAMFIVAQCQSLRVSVHWECLISNAETRKVLVTVDGGKPNMKDIVKRLKRKR